MANTMKAIDIPDTISSELFIKKIAKIDDCWCWVGQIDRNGYGVFSHAVSGKRKQLLAHRVSYKLFKGKPNNLLVIDHICRNRKCVNPEHLREVTRRVNATENSLSISAKNKSKEKCKNGHDFTFKTLKNGKKRRDCEICLKEKDREKYKRTIIRNKMTILRKFIATSSKYKEFENICVHIKYFLAEYKGNE